MAAQAVSLAADDAGSTALAEALGGGAAIAAAGAAVGGADALDADPPAGSLGAIKETAT